MRSYSKVISTLTAVPTASLLYCMRPVGYSLRSQLTGFSLTDLENTCQVSVLKYENEDVPPLNLTYCVCVFFFLLSVHPSEADPAFQVTLVNATRWQNYGTPNVAGRLKMTWNGSLIAADKVNVELWGYREFSSRSSSTGAAMNGPSSPRAELSYLYSLDRNVVNSGAFSFVPESSKDHSDWVLGNIRITASSQSDGARYPKNISAVFYI